MSASLASYSSPTSVTHAPIDRRLCNATQFSLRDQCLLPHYLIYSPHTVVIYGYVMPTLVVVTIATNSLICAVLVTPKMLNPSNTILVAMAVSDMLTGVWTLPCFIYFYTLGAQHEYVPYRWCLVYFWLTDYLPTVFHTASIWLTVALAAQRFLISPYPADMNATFIHYTRRYARFRYGQIQSTDSP